MGNIQIENTDISKIVKEICKNFFESYKFKINGFSYSRVFPDGSRSELWSDVQALNHTFFSKKYISKIYTPDLYKNNEKMLLLEEKIPFFKEDVQENYINQIYDQKILFNHDKPFIIIDKGIEMVEYFIFYISNDSNFYYNFYLNHLDHMRTFIRNFKIKAASLINKADKNKVVMPWRKVKTYNENYLIKNKKHKITNREMIVLEYSIQGKTAKEIGEILGVSFRTVEAHISNIKNKFLCKTKTELISKFFNGELS